MVFAFVSASRLRRRYRTNVERRRKRQNRAPDLPDVPSLKDLGEPVFDGGTTIGVYVRQETPAPLVQTINAGVVAALKDPAVNKRPVELGAVVRPSTPEEFVAVMKSDEQAIGELEKAGLLKPE